MFIIINNFTCTQPRVTFLARDLTTFKPLSNEKNATVWKGEVNAAYGDRVSLPSRLP